MTPEKYKQLKPLFEQALDTPPAQRADFILTIRMADEELGRELESLIESHSSETDGSEAHGSRSGDETKSIDTPLVTFNHVFPSEPPSFAPKEMLLDRFRIVRFIGKGGMGEVYEAEDMHLGRVAIKTIRTDLAGRPEILARFRQEVQLARRVASPAVCRIHELFPLPAGDRRGAAAFLTMEYLEGVTLAERLERNGALPVPEAESTALQLCAAVQAIHDAGVLHRDIKSRNIMLVPKNGASRVVTQVVVMDLGLAGEAARGADSDTGLTVAGAVMGTRAYMAPELLTGARATPASDVFALGVVFYEMVTGKLPPEVLPGRAAPPVSLLRKGLPKHWDRVISGCLQYEREKRYQSANELADALQGNTGTFSMKLPVITRRRAAVAAVPALALAGAAAGWLEWVNVSRRLPPEAQALYQKGIADNAAGAWFAATKALEEAVKLAPQAPEAHARLAEAWVGLEMPEKAGEEMLLARRQDLSKLPRTDRLQIEAIDLSITREFAAAAAKYEEMARIDPASAEIAVDLGRAYEKADRPDDAIRSYRRAAEGQEHNPAAWLRLGVLYALQLNKAKSGEAFAQADRLYQLTSNLEGLTEVALQQGIAANARGQLDEGATFLRKALDTARLAGNLQEEINATLRLSSNAYLRGDTTETDRYAREALETAQSHHLDAMAIRGLVNLGNAFNRKQDFAHSEQYYREALDLARQTRSSHLTALSLLSLAGLHDQMRQLDDAVREAQEALTFYQANRYAKESLQCLTVIARAKRDSGDYNGALDSFRSMLQMAESSQDHFQLASAHEGIGSMLFKQDRFPEALEQYRKMLEFAPDAEHTGYASLECGNTLWRLGQYAEAAEMFAKADAIAKSFAPLRLQLMYGRAGMLLSQNRYAEAAEMVRGALASDIARTPELQNQFERILGLALLGMGNKGEGAKKCEAARTAIEARHDIDDTLEAGVAALEARVRQGERKSALQLFQQMEPPLAARPELQWRALALAAGVDAHYSGAAREALLKLQHLWGDSAYNTYLTRPDVGEVSRSFLGRAPISQ